MPYCILVSGMPATGKSTMAAYLAGELGMTLIAKDAIKERLFDTLGFSSRAEKVKLGEAAMHLMFDFARACLIAGQGVVLENNFEYASREALEEFLRGCPCRVITVHMTGDLQAIYARFAARDRSPDRHRGHVVNDCYPEKAGMRAPHQTISFEEFAAGMKARGMDVPPQGVPSIRVDTTDFANVRREDVLARLRAWMAAPEGGALQP